MGSTVNAHISESFHSQPTSPRGNWMGKLLVGLLFFTLLSTSSLKAQSGGAIADSVATFLSPENLNYFLGFGVNVIERGRDDYSFTHGYQDNEEINPWSDSTLFNLGSVSKLFTAIAMVSLAEQGLVNLDDPVAYYFPEFLHAKGKTRSLAQITVRDLLLHQSGINQSMEALYPEVFDKEVIETEEEYFENTFNYRAFLTKEDFKDRFIMYGRIDKKPRKKYHFSNLGYVILGYIVEEVTQQNIGQYITNQIFVPLEMNDSHYYMTPDSQTHHLAKGYYHLKDGSYLNVHENEVESPSPTGDGGIKTSLRDMRKFMHFLIGEVDNNKQYDAILPRSVLLDMMAPKTKGPDKQTYAGLGFHNLQPFNFAGHAGGWDGFLSILYYHPSSHSCILLTTNREDNELFLFLRVYAAYATLHQEF